MLAPVTLSGATDTSNILTDHVGVSMYHDYCIIVTTAAWNGSGMVVSYIQYQVKWANGYSHSLDMETQ